MMTAAPPEPWSRADYDEEAARDLLMLLAHAHAVLDQRDHRDGRYIPPAERIRHTPRHHPAWHDQSERKGVLAR